MIDKTTPAFPQKEPLTSDEPGMTLRQYYAGQALQALIGLDYKDDCKRGAKGVPLLAKYAVEYADALLLALADKPDAAPMTSEQAQQAANNQASTMLANLAAQAVPKPGAFQSFGWQVMYMPDGTIKGIEPAPDKPAPSAASQVDPSMARPHRQWQD